MFHLIMLKYTTDPSLQDGRLRAHDTSSGPYEIYYQSLKHLPSSSLLLLLNIFNISI